MPKQLFLALFLLFFCLRGFSAVFVVTSNADSGPSTLRDALTQAAASSTETNYINFNIPGTSLADRTITLESPLPNVTSNLIIDGTTQPGGGINFGDAGINITPDRYTYLIPLYATGALMLDGVKNVQIYGLAINGFFGLKNNYPSSGSIINSGIYIVGSDNITIGSPNKGNFICDNDYDIFTGTTDYLTNDTVYNVTMQSNYLGYNFPTSAFSNYGLALRCSNLLFGGDGPLQGNHLVGVLNISGSNNQIVHNYLGFDNNNTPLTNNWAVIYAGGHGLTIRNNLSNVVNFNLQGLYNFKIYANSDAGNLDNVIQGITMYDCGDGVIGSDDISQQNIFHGVQNSFMLGNQDSNNIQVLKNSITCSSKAYNIYNEIPAVIIIPDIKVLVNNNNEFSGTASPNSKIYVYEDNTNCPICNPVAYITTLVADVNGNWKLTGNFTNKKMLANALLNKNSSEYTIPEIPDNYKNGLIVNPSCGLNNGSISITDAIETLKIIWYDSNDKEIGEGNTVNGLGAGNYYAKAINGNCSIKSPVYNLYNAQLQILDNYISVINPSCGKGGSITGLIISNNSQDLINYAWTDENNKVVGNSSDVDNLPAGKYTLNVTDIATKCSISYGPVVLKNTTGPNIDQSNQIIQPTNCGQSTGSITNIAVTGTGTLKFVWLNDQQQQVGTDKDLINQPAGTYKLQVTDDSQCGPVYSADAIIPETNGITMDESKVQVTNALCGGTGSITGIQVTGASGYKWTDANNHTLITTTPDVGTLAPGSYTLTATNTYGCSKNSAVYIISQPTSFPWPDYTATYTKACNLLNNGGVSVATDNLVVSARWVDAQGTTVGTGSTLSGVVAGTYQLYLTDHNGCEKLYNSYTIDQYPEFTVAAPPATITADECGLHNGSVGATTIAGGIPPYTYTWHDTNNKALGTTNILTNLTAGTYILNVTDNGCGDVDITYIVPEQTSVPDAPSVSPVQLCSSGSGVLTVNNPSASTTYRLYTSQSGGQPIDEQKGGRFTINIANSTSYYVSEIEGTCESSRAEIPVTVGVGSTDIANAFTPNGDGINDYWQIKNIQNYASATVQVFNRYGQLLFESKGYARPWDGTYNGQKLPAGVYYYIINLNTRCNILSGSLTLIR